MPSNTKEDQQKSTDESACTYEIDTAWFEQNNKSLVHVLRLRLCETCQKKQSKKNMNKEKWENLLKSIVTHCHKQPTFITPEKGPFINLGKYKDNNYLYQMRILDLPEDIVNEIHLFIPISVLSLCNKEYYSEFIDVYNEKRNIYFHSEFLK